MSTYWVALCEDEAVERGQITDLCQDILATQGVEAEIVPFSSADELRQAAEEKRAAFDLYLLDIQMEGHHRLRTGSVALRPGRPGSGHLHHRQPGIRSGRV